MKNDAGRETDMQRESDEYEMNQLAGEALRSLADGLAIVDSEDRVVFVNPRAETFFGLESMDWRSIPAQALYRAIADRTSRGDALVHELDNAAGRAEDMPRVEFAILDPDERVVEAKWFPLRDDQMQPLGYGVLFRDVTREKELDQLKSQLLSTVSHELRTPLSSIKGFTTTLLRDDVRWDEPTQRDFLKIIEEESARLEELIDDLLDMSQLETGTLRVNPEPTQLRSLLRDGVERMRRQSEAHWFVLDLPSDLPRVWADAKRVRQVLHNLLENAVKYSPEGGQITIACEVEGENLIVSVGDQGPGIPSKYREQIFERFFQVDGAATRKTGGSGLGLAISKGIVDAHGGKIWVESAEGQGSVFRFSLPLVKGQEVTQPD